MSTAREFLEDRANTLAGTWMAAWLPKVPHAVIVNADGWAGPRDLKTLDAPLPAGVHAVGWSGLTAGGVAEWVGFDLDVGHGAKNYPTTTQALDAAHQIRAALQGNAEIRLSKSGAGVHVRHWCAPARLDNQDAIKFAKRLVARLGIQADPTPLGRQAFWFWARTPGADSFRLIAEDDGLETALPGRLSYAA